LGKDDAFRQRFAAAMDDDFNTAEALAVLFDMAREINRLRETGAAEAARLAAGLRDLAGVLGLLDRAAEAFLRGGDSGGPTDAEIEDLIARRIAARASRDWAEADRIRDDLQARGVVLEDGAGGTTWRRQ
jgi:cysteinyl-tRNA synthetase